jgi:hypothetical protein
MDETIQKSEMIAFVRSKIDNVENDIRARQESEKTWRWDTEESWRAVGCKMNKKERIATADVEARIIIKLDRQLRMFNAILNELE